MTDAFVAPAALAVKTNARPMLAAAVIVIHVVLLGWSGWRHSPTVDETAHLPAGLRIWATGACDLYTVNPPLVRLLAALPVHWARPQVDWRRCIIDPAFRSEFLVGQDFVAANQSRCFWYITLARWACLPFSVLGAVVAYHWAGQLYGAKSGLMALALWCFSPAILGNAALITTDAPAAACGLAAAFFFWRWLQKPGWASAILAGIALGLAELCKFTWLMLFILWPLLWGLKLWSARRERRGLAEAAELAMILGLAVYVINAGYGFESSFRKLGDFTFVSSVMNGVPDLSVTFPDNRFRKSPLANLPVPFPANYLTGIDAQKKDFERGAPSYLAGRWRTAGCWYYYLYAIVVKEPIGTFMLAGLAVVASLRRVALNRGHRCESVLFVPALGVLALVSSQTGMNNHSRYILPCLPFAYVWVSQTAEFLDLRSNRVYSTFLTMSLAFFVVSSLVVFPHSLSYFNEWAGGPENGHAHLLNSNIDWGQDLLYLKSWCNEHPEALPLGLACYGSVNPLIAGIYCTPPPTAPTAEQRARASLDSHAGPVPGWFAISVNALRGEQFLIFEGDARATFHRGSYTWFLRFQPVARAGYSIDIYHITLDEANRARREMRLPELPAAQEPHAAHGASRSQRKSVVHPMPVGDLRNFALVIR